MKFGPTPVAAAEGAVLAHGVRAGTLSLKKGERLDAGRIAALHAAGVRDVVAVRLEPGDVGEDEAATILAAKVAGKHLRRERAFTGRVNMFADAAGLALVDAGAVDAVNAIDESITLATLPPFRRVAPGDMVATVKIIPFAVAQDKLDSAGAAAGESAVAVAPFRPLKVAIVSTVTPALKPSIVEKTLDILAARLEAAKAPLVGEVRVAHDTAALAAKLPEACAAADVVVVFGASAISDRRDVIPAALEAAGGKVLSFGMPVDPGNLLLLGELQGKAVIGAPGCARSPKENGFDWVLDRTLAGVPVSPRDLRAMGVGGLLMEIATRPQPRLSRD